MIELAHAEDVQQLVRLLVRGGTLSEQTASADTMAAMEWAELAQLVAQQASS